MRRSKKKLFLKPVEAMPFIAAKGLRGKKGMKAPPHNRYPDLKQGDDRLSNPKPILPTAQKPIRYLRRQHERT